jgi:hypothetical protein
LYLSQFLYGNILSLFVFCNYYYTTIGLESICDEVVITGFLLLPLPAVDALFEVKFVPAVVAYSIGSRPVNDKAEDNIPTTNTSFIIINLTSSYCILAKLIERR